MSDFFTMHPGETAAPVPPGPALCAGTAAMRRVHRVFLWAYDEAPGLVRSAQPGDTERASYVGEVLGTFDRLLHVHHESEDALMYPKLSQRAPACALHAEQMIEQHRQVAERLVAIEPLRLQWMTAADSLAGEDLAQRYADLSALLKVHLRREVTEVMPAVEKVMTEEELASMAKHSQDEFSVKVMLAYLGLVLATNPPGEREELFKDIPAPIRLAYRLLGRRLYRKQYSTLFPGREVPATL
ncbi:hemerythrin domain-containing protein [Sinomonas mesophila]|uniref:hemerythrin domain-containing protein n=1 Tax=Sinomonas mesophila TaxID=1531955 RepID=UPI000984E9A1|nr:hemerythrin domain-containing protein [Sinomonas mesophila]